MSAFLTRRAQQVAKWLLLLIMLLPRPCRAGPAPVIIVQPLSMSVLNLDVASFTVVAASGTTMTYQWYKNGNGNPIPGATSATYTILSATPADQGRYYVKITNAYGAVQSSWANLTILSAPVITTQPVSQIATQGQAASFSVRVTANPSPSYQWFFNGAPLHEAKYSTLNFSSVDWNNSGTYSVVVSNAYGSVTSAPATLTVVGNLAVNLTTVATPILGSSGFTFQFSVPPGFTYVVMASADLLNWAPIATNIANANSVLFTDPAASNFPRRFYRIGLQ
jgi:hypothetical protein